MKKELMVLFLFVSLFFVMQGVVGQTGNTKSESGEVFFSNNGCDTPSGPVNPGRCTSDGKYYCSINGNNEYYSTIYPDPNSENACVGKNEGTGYTSSNPCCPGGTHECTRNDDSSPYYCRASLDDCSSWTTKTECEDDPTKGGGGQCYWFAAGNECVPRRDNCYDITEESICDGNTQVGQKDVNCRYGEFEVGGVTYQISKDTCICKWDDAKGCGLEYEIQRGVFGTGLPKTSCVYTLEETTNGECNAEGYEIYKYIASNPQDDIGKSGAFENLLGGDSLCFDREGRRACGDPVVRVPFFSFFNVLVVLVIIGIFYVLQSKRLSKKKSKTKSHRKKKR